MGVWRSVFGRSSCRTAKWRWRRALGALPPDPRSLARWRPMPARGQKQTRARLRSPGRLAYSRPAGARVALLRSPILPTARRRIPRAGSGVQPKIIRGETHSSGRSDRPLTADISTVRKMRTFLLLPDRRPIEDLPQHQQMSIMRWTNTNSPQAAAAAIADVRSRRDAVFARIQGAGRVFVAWTASHVPF